MEMMCGRTQQGRGLEKTAGGAEARWGSNGPGGSGFAGAALCQSAWALRPWHLGAGFALESSRFSLRLEGTFQVPQHEPDCLRHPGIFHPALSCPDPELVWVGLGREVLWLQLGRLSDPGSGGQEPDSALCRMLEGLCLSLPALGQLPEPTAWSRCYHVCPFQPGLG